MDGVIAISRYLYEYYNDRVNTIQIPPLVDIQEEKWNSLEKINSEVTKFVYAGVPSSQKERIDILVDAIEFYTVVCYVFQGAIVTVVASGAHKSV